MEKAMKKIPSLFKRDYKNTKLVYNEVVEGCEWVINGEGIATRKYDGTACAIINGKLYKRYDVKEGRKVPENAIPCQEPDKITGHWPHWILCDRNKKDDKYFLEAFNNLSNKIDGTYELCGPKINSNLENYNIHKLIKHGDYIFLGFPTDFEKIKEKLKDLDIEGIVWHHPDGRMCKIKKKDFGFKR